MTLISFVTSFLKSIIFSENMSAKICQNTRRGKWGKVMTRGKVIFRSTGFNVQMASFEKKLVLLQLDIF